MLKSFCLRYSQGGRTLLLNLGLLALAYGAQSGWVIYQYWHPPLASWEKPPLGWESLGKYDGLGQTGPVTFADMLNFVSSRSLTRLKSSDDLLKTSWAIKNQLENELGGRCEALKKGSPQFQWVIENRNELMVVNRVSLPEIEPNKTIEILRLLRSGSRIVTVIIYVEDNAYTVELLTRFNNQ